MLSQTGENSKTFKQNMLNLSESPQAAWLLIDRLWDTALLSSLMETLTC